MKLLCVLFFLTAILSGFNEKLFSQTLSVGLMENVEDLYRREQLLGKDSSGQSYMIRPINSNSSLSYLHAPLYQSINGKTFVAALPVVWENQYNSHHPYGMNDGSMVLAKGFQAQLSAGIFAKAGPFSIQLRPEFVFAENKDYRELYEAGNGSYFIAAYIKNFYNKIDLPGRFADGTYNRASWGQSSIRLTFDPVSVGLSNENLWWGPGRRSSLLMSDNAPGFKHLTLNTSKPVNTVIGSFEAQIIAGRLDFSGAPKIDDRRFGKKSADWRYISGIAVTYNPKWVPQLYLGLDRSFVVNSKDLGSGFSDYFPFLSALTKVSFYNKETGLYEEDGKKRDQYISLFARWVLPESKAEVYLQYGRNDHSGTARDFLLEPDHSRAYIVGLKKLIPFRKTDQFIEFGIEAIQASAGRVRAVEPWYAHYQVSSGYTNRGQVLGAGIGPASNMQSIDVSWVSGLKKIGFAIDRIEQNNDLFYLAYNNSNIHKWEDWAYSGKLNWNFKQFMLNSELTYIHSVNYQYTPHSMSNVHLKLGLLYLF